METFSALLTLCAGNSPVTGEFPSQRPVTRGFDGFLSVPWINGWVSSRRADDLRRHRTHYDVIVMVPLGSRCAGEVAAGVVGHRPSVRPRGHHPPMEGWISLLPLRRRPSQGLPWLHRRGLQIRVRRGGLSASQDGLQGNWSGLDEGIGNYRNLLTNSNAVFILKIHRHCLNDVYIVISLVSSSGVVVGAQARLAG